MSYNPISGTVPQYSTANNELASGYYLKFYSESTTTPLSMATGANGSTLLAKCKLNPSGSPISNPADNTTVFIPHMNANYRIVLYKNEADADANTTGNAEWNIDGILYGGAEVPAADAATLTTRATTLEALDDYDRSPLFVSGTDFTAGAPPHSITVPAGWTPSNADVRFWKMSSSGAIAAAVISASTTTDFTVNESLLSTDTIFIGDDVNRNIHDGDPLDIRTRISVYSKAESDAAFIEDTANAVDATNLATDSVTTVKIAALNVTAAKLASNAVETAKIKDLNVTSAKLATSTSQALVPSGGIIMYTGSSAPSGWAFCDGTSGTPDLRNLFIKGKATIGAASTTGGSATVTPAGSVTVNNHTLTAAQMPAHTHNTVIPQDGGINVWKYTVGNTETNGGNSTFTSSSAGSGAGHNHGASFTGTSHNNEPAYYTLAYIMKL